jgi:protein involved in polysaccharide export with SLBB domain
MDIESKTMKHCTDADFLRRRARSALGPLALALVLSVALLAPFAPAYGSDNYIPFVEPLQVTQKRAYYSAAPAGQDQPLAAPEAPLTFEVQPLAADEDSRLEAEARERRDAPSLEQSAQEQSLKDELAQFGYDIFSRAPSTFAPVEGIPVPADYRIGPGDHLVVQLFGKRNVEYSLVVTRDGKILVPEFGPVAVGGLTFDDAETLITSGFEQRVIGARAVVTMGKLRTIQVRLAGDVRQPGIYTVGGLSSLIDALLTTGGVSGTGTLRDIQLIRDGKVISHLDLYQLLLSGKAEGDHFLRHHDTIFVPAIGPIVYVGGDVHRPAIYELRGETTLGDVIDMAGGLLPTASLGDSHIERIRDDGSRVLMDFRSAGMALSVADMLATPIENGDLLRILPLEDQLREAVQLSGPVERPGAYQYRPGMRLSDLLGDSSAMLPGVDTAFALVERIDPRTLRSTVRYAAPLAALESPGSDKDPLLQARDRVHLLPLGGDRSADLAGIMQKLENQVADRRGAALVEVRGAVRHTGPMPLAEDARLLDSIALAGGLLPGSDGHYGVIARTELPGLELRLTRFSLAAARRDASGPANPQLARGDRIYFFADDSDRSGLLADEVARLRKRARFGTDAPVVSLLGNVLSAGDFPLLPGMRASDLLCAGRGLTLRADGVTAELSLQRSGDDATPAHMTLDSRELMELCELSRADERGELDAQAQAAFARRYADSARNPVLAPRHQLALARDPEWREPVRVTLSGEVMRPGVYVASEGETLCEVLQRAGGLADAAYAFGAEFTRESVRNLQQQTLDELQAQLDDLMVELSLSHSFNNAEKSSHEWSGKQDTLRVIRQLERAEATGRMVVDLDRVQRCHSRDALVLEDGDSLFVPRQPNHVQVSGQVYVATSHLHDDDRSIRDYIELSGGATVLGRLDHAYVIQANGEVLSLKGSRSSRRIARTRVMPGARIYVPINVDRMNPTEKAQSWVSTLAQSAILAGIVL